MAKHKHISESSARTLEWMYRKASKNLVLLAYEKAQGIDSGGLAGVPHYDLCKKIYDMVEAELIRRGYTKEQCEQLARRK